MTAVSEVLFFEEFTWSSETKTLVAEASSLGYDAPPECFAINRKHTGRQVAFISKGTDRTPSGDVAGWTYVPTDPSMLGKVSVLIIND